MKRLLTILAALAIMLSLCGCEMLSFKPDRYFLRSGREAPYKDGIYMFSDNMLGFLDLDSLEFRPLCYIQNCDHTNPQLCPSLTYPEASSVFVLDDKLYILTPGEDKGICLYRLHPDGSSKEQISIIADSSYPGDVLIDGSIVYLCADNCLYSIDVISWERITLLKAESSICLTGEYSNILYLKADDCYVAYNIAEDSFEPINEDVLFADDGGVVVKNSDNTLSVATDEYDITVMANHFTQEFTPSILLNGYLLDPANGLAYDIDSCETVTIPVCRLVAYYHGRYIVCDSNNLYRSLSPEEFFTGNNTV